MRPKKINDVVLAKLKEAFLLGCTDKEACLLAGINPATLYRYQDQNVEFCERKEVLKQNPFLLARTSVIKQIKTDGDLALKFLERAKKDEFSPRSEIVDKTPIEIKWIEE